MRGVAIAGLILLSGCASSTEPTQAELKARWEARTIQPANYKADILAFMRTYLNNPAGVRSAGVSPPFLKALPSDPAPRYVACVRYDARTDSGRYAGVKIGIAAFSAGRFERFFDNQREAPEFCKDASYEPFPELQRLTR